MLQPGKPPACQELGNHSAVADNLVMVSKMLLKEGTHGCSLMLDPAIMDHLKNIKQTPHGMLHLV
jgi:hypothetical protein